MKKFLTRKTNIREIASLARDVKFFILVIFLSLVSWLNSSSYLCACLFEKLKVELYDLYRPFKFKMNVYLVWNKYIFCTWTCQINNRLWGFFKVMVKYYYFKKDLQRKWQFWKILIVCKNTSSLHTSSILSGYLDKDVKVLIFLF